ncbi:hypothetical protein AVL56_04390 [Alteromonas stellipolaris]|uniref:hypothetical protein n=1 Tax=Alteromonas stellipolaris TaxID=233316 RepID=UPI00077060F2|nr:hypothetical protein [Alteromonas stellipolaris]AMJ93615.1 hypothetical protein AVL56_04390 [Alteromonas stellipolaris]
MNMPLSATASAVNSQTNVNINAVNNIFEQSEAAYEAMVSIVGEPLRQILEPYWLTANPDTNKLRLKLSSAPISLEMTFWEWIALILEPQLNGEFEGLQIIDTYFQGQKLYDLSHLDSAKLTSIVLCYQLDEDGERIEGANDLEISVYWHKDMTQTNDVLLIEKLFTDMVKRDFTIEHLDHYLALIGNPDE